MKILDGVVRKLTNAKKSRFSESSDWVVAITGLMAFFIAGYWGLMLGDIVPNAVKKSNEVGFTPDGILLAVFLSGFGLLFWFFGNIAARCNGILYERWFK